MKPLISVIIPVYQVEAYLRRAVDSVLGQTYRNLDIILVDDGSPDRCGMICDEYAAREARVRVVHKQNGGLSDARNAGLDVAGGDYIAFLDSDDYYAPCFIEVLYEELIRHHARVAICQYAVTGPGSGNLTPDFGRYEKSWRSRQAEILVYSGEELLQNQYDAIFEDATYFIVSWNKLYDARLWKEIRFPKGRIHEDEATTYKVLERAAKGVYVKLPLYAYFSAAGSITRDKFSVKRLDWAYAMTDRILYFEQREMFSLAKAALRARADGCIRYFYPLRSQVRSSKKEQAILKDYVREALVTDRIGRPEERHFLPLRTAIGYRIFLLSPSLYKKILKRR